MKNTKFESNDIFSIKFVSKAEVIAKFVSANDDGVWVVSKPMILTATQNGLGLMPFILTASQVFPDNIEMNSNAFIAVATVDEEMKTAYLQSTTGLHLV